MVINSKNIKNNLWNDHDYEDFSPLNLWDEITKNLWQGGTDDSDIIGTKILNSDYEPTITVKNFDTVLTLHAWSNPADWGVKELRYPFHDGVIGKDVHPRELFFLTKYIDDELKQGKRVLVRCLAGLNRSGLINSLVLVRQGLSPSQALDLVRSRRSVWSLCNPDFESWFLNIKAEDWRENEFW